jgi:hypothetical protein
MQLGSCNTVGDKEMMDKNGYPTEETLEKIAKFNPLTDNVYEFVEYLCENLAKLPWSGHARIHRDMKLGLLKST